MFLFFFFFFSSRRRHTRFDCDWSSDVCSSDLTRHILEQIALEGYGEGWLSEEQVRRLLGYETRLDVHGFLKDHGVYLRRSEERRVGKECRSRWSPYH